MITTDEREADPLIPMEKGDDSCEYLLYESPAAKRLKSDGILMQNASTINCTNSTRVRLSASPMRSLAVTAPVSISVDSDDDEGDPEHETWNNLYWCETLNSPCLWLHDDDDARPLDVAVDLNDPKWYVSVALIQYSVLNYPSDTAGGCTSVSVLRGSLVHLDEKVLVTKCLDSTLGDFCRALTDFAEWDDHGRGDYGWPRFIRRLMGNAANLRKWIEVASDFQIQGVGIQSHSLHSIFFALLCAEHLSVNGYAGDSPASFALSEFVQYIDQMRARCNAEQRRFIRSSSRVGEEYQSEIAPTRGGDIGIDSASDCCFDPNRISPLLLEHYLSSVKQLSVSTVREGRFLMAPERDAVVSLELPVDELPVESPLFANWVQARVMGSAEIPYDGNLRLCLVTHVLDCSSTKLTFSNVPLESSNSQNYKMPPDVCTPREVVQLDLNDGEVVCVHKNAHSAAVSLGGDALCIHNCCNAVGDGRICYGFRWRFSWPLDSAPGLSSATNTADSDHDLHIGSETSLYADLSTSQSCQNVDDTVESESSACDMLLVDEPWAWPSIADREQRQENSSRTAVCVTDGFNLWWTPVKECRDISIPEDASLEILHNCAYCVDDAIDIIKALLNNISSGLINGANNTAEQSRRLIPFLDTAWDVAHICDLILSVPERDYRNFDAREEKLDVKSIFKKFMKTAKKRLGGRGPTVHDGDIDSAPTGKTLHQFIEFFFKFFVSSFQRMNKMFEGHKTLDIPQIGIYRQLQIGLEAAQSQSVWPTGLRFAVHNIYWHKTSCLPCVCTGLPRSNEREAGGKIHIVTICSQSYNHEITVSSAALEPFTADVAKLCTNERAAGFAQAMIDFYEWEIENYLHVDQSPFFYCYPDFIYKMLTHNPTFSSWRTKCEREVRGRKESRRTTYFNGILTDYLSLTDSAVKDAQRRHEMSKRLPWVLLPREGRAAKTISSAPIVMKPAAATTRPRHSNNNNNNNSGGGGGSRPRAASEGTRAAPTAAASKSPPQRVWSRLNMYWLPLSELPCLYYDEKEKLRSDKFYVLPICCQTYHYAVQVNQNMLQQLTSERLKRCSDDRTQDFTHALMEFAEWDIAWDRSSTAALAEAEKVGGGNSDVAPTSTLPQVDESSPYEWPAFILNLLCSPREWASWRKGVERNAAKHISRKRAYLLALQQQWKEILKIS